MARMANGVVTHSEVVSRRFGSKFDRPCKRPSILECAMFECQIADRCMLHNETREQLIDRIDALLAATTREAALVKALVPFAKHADFYDSVAGGYPDENICSNRIGGRDFEHVVTIGDFRRARAALASVKEPQT